jgi:hypothetical protein
VDPVTIFREICANLPDFRGFSPLESPVPLTAKNYSVILLVHGVLQNALDKIVYVV